MGAHPGGFFGRFTDAEPYAEDLEFWSSVRHASRRDDFDEWIREWVLDPPDHAAYLDKLGPERITRLRDRARPDSWRDDQAAFPPDLDQPVNAWESAAVHGARLLAQRIAATDADCALAGAGVANLATWLGVRLARDGGAGCVLTAELGLWEYEPTPADPFVFNHRAFPSATMLADSSEILGMAMSGPGTRSIACLGAAIIDAEGYIDSSVLPDRAFLVGSGGGNDVASTADEVIVVTTLTSRRTVERVPYITSPGARVSHLVTDLAVFAKGADGRFVLNAVRPGAIDQVRDLVGWELSIADDLHQMAEPDPADVAALRRWDPRGFFLRA